MRSEKETEKAQKNRKLVGNGGHRLSYQESEKEKGDREKRGLEGGEEDS